MNDDKRRENAAVGLMLAGSSYGALIVGVFGLFAALQGGVDVVTPGGAAFEVAAWHQDRWSTGGGQGVGAACSLDGGATWTPVVIPFSRCAGAAAGSAGDFERASDPWISFGPDGAAYYMALVLDDLTAAGGMSVAKSVDGGASTSAP